MHMRPPGICDLPAYARVAIARGSLERRRCARLRTAPACVPDPLLV